MNPSSREPSHTRASSRADAQRRVGLGALFGLSAVFSLLGDAVLMGDYVLPWSLLVGSIGLMLIGIVELLPSQNRILSSALRIGGDVLLFSGIAVSLVRLVLYLFGI